MKLDTLWVSFLWDCLALHGKTRAELALLECPLLKLAVGKDHQELTLLCVNLQPAVLTFETCCCAEVAGTH